MNLLPWLLRWPPRPAVVVAVLLVTLVTAGTLAAFGGTPVDPADRSVAVEDIDVTVRLNDEAAAPPGGAQEHQEPGQRARESGRALDGLGDVHRERARDVGHADVDDAGRKREHRHERRQPDGRTGPQDLRPRVAQESPRIHIPQG